MTTIIVQENEQPSSQLPMTEPEQLTNPPLEAVAELVETETDTAIEIAQIEADTRVEIATINAAVEIASIEARQETHEDIQWLRSRLTELEAENSTLRAELLTPQIVEAMPSEALVSEEVVEMAEAEAESLTPTETPLTPPSIAEETSSTLTEAIVKSEGDALEVLDLPPALSVPKRGPIIRLV